MYRNFFETPFGKTGKTVNSLGLSATYRPGKKALYKAIDEGVSIENG